MDRPIEWQSGFSVDIQVIDDQHRHMIEIINRLFEQLSTKVGPIELDSFFEDAIAYGEYHFQTEENFFSRYTYPARAAHRQAHRDYKAKVNALVAETIDTHAAATALLDFLEEWWVGHITGMDQTLRLLVTPADSTPTSSV